MDITRPDSIPVSPSPLRVLIVEDNPRDAKLMASALEGGGSRIQYEVTDSPEVFRERLEKVEYDVILADFNLRNWTAVDALEILKHSGKDVPLIVVTGSLGDEAAVECIKQGAADFVLKDRPARLPTAVQRALEDKKLREERQRTEEELRKSERKYRQLHESMVDGFVRVNMTGRITEANDAFCRMLGYTPEELLKFPYSNLTPEKWHASETDIIEEEVLTRGYSEVYFKEYQQKDGGILPVEVRKYLMLDESGNPSGIWAIVRDITERKWAEQMLREYEKVVEGSGDMIAVVDRKYRYLLANRAYLEQRGLERGDVVGSSVPEVLGEEHFEGVVKKNLDECFQGNVVRYEMKQQFPKIGKRDLQVSYFPIEGSQGVDRAACVLQDITERKRAEEALQNEKAFTESIIDSLPDIFYVIDSQGRYLRWNKNAERILGYSSEELAAMDPLANIAEEERPLAASKIQEAFAKGSTTAEVHLLTKDGRKIPYILTAKRAVIGDKVYLVGIGVDITERKRAEAERSRLMTAIEQAAESVVITDAEGGIQYVNPAFSAMTGYSREEALGKNPRILKSGKQDAAFYASLWATLLAGQAWRGEMINRRKDGSLYTEKMSITPVRNERGETTHFVAMKEDITARKLLEDQFRQAQKMEAVGRLAAGVAHDFNNLLTIIIGYSDVMLERFVSGDPLRAYTTEIKGAGERAVGLTRQLLAFSRQQVLAPQVLDLNTLIPNLTKLLRRLIGEDIDLVFNAGPSPATVKADPGHIEQVLMNLTVNSRDAMPRGGKLTIETSHVEVDEAYGSTHYSMPAGSYVMLAVSDTGCGMDKDIQAHVFEPFFTTKETGKGTGLGLATVYGIVKQSGGHIWVYSEPGAGATFKIYLPAAKGAHETAKESAVPAGGSETVLLVEDDAGLRELARMILEARGGYKVLESPGGKEARLFAEQHKGPIHLLLTDVVMPGLSGRELSEKLATLRPEMKVLYMSGYTDDTVLRHGVLEEGMAFLQKPFTAESLLRKVRDVLDTRPRGLKTWQADA